MSDPLFDTIKFAIVTNDVAQAARDVLSCSVAEIPRFALVTDDDRLIECFPSAVPVLGRFYPGRFQTMAELAWSARKARKPDLTWFNDRIWDGIAEWQRRRAATEAAIVAEVLAEERGEAEAAPMPGMPAMSEMPGALAAPAKPSQPVTRYR